jgi:POT family proton-dependent oligopeptide transporter
MQSLLVLYMVNRLLHPGHIERIAGFGPFRHLLESIYRGPLSVQALASAIFGLYTGLVYLTPIGGGLIATVCSDAHARSQSVRCSWRPDIF